MNATGMGNASELVTEYGAENAAASLIDKVVHLTNVTGTLKVSTEKAVTLKGCEPGEGVVMMTRRMCHGNATVSWGSATLSRAE